MAAVADFPDAFGICFFVACAVRFCYLYNKTAGSIRVSDSAQYRLHIVNTGAQIRQNSDIGVHIVAIGAVGNLDLIWSVSETMNGLMAIPNLIGVVCLVKVVTSLTKKHFNPEKE